MTYKIAYARENENMCEIKEVVILLQEQGRKPLKNNMCTEGPNNERYIVTRYTEDQAGQDIRDEDVIQAENSVWYTKAEIKTWRDKTTAGIPTYGNCVNCYWGGPVGLKCTHCDGKIIKDPTYQVHELRRKILDSRWVAGYFERGHDVAKADRSTGGYEPARFSYPHSENLRK